MRESALQNMYLDLYRLCRETSLKRQIMYDVPDILLLKQAKCRCVDMPSEMFVFDLWT